MKIQTTCRLPVLFSISLFLFATSAVMIQRANAQVLYGSVVGLVQDSSGGVIPGATITLTNKQTSQTHETKSDEGGRYSISNVLPGQYDLKVTANGFKAMTRTDVGITVN